MLERHGFKRALGLLVEAVRRGLISIMEARRDAERLVEGGYRVGEKVLKEFHAMLEEEETG